jgi:hypothetical protein
MVSSEQSANRKLELPGCSDSVGVEARVGELKTLAKFTACRVRNTTDYVTGLARAKNSSFPLILRPASQSGEKRFVPLLPGGQLSASRPPTTEG